MKITVEQIEAFKFAFIRKYLHWWASELIRVGLAEMNFNARIIK